MSDLILKNDERAIFALRSLYTKYGYLPYKMNKFEEYDLYVRNKDFLVSNNVITFNDTNGRLLALKPDVTLSIIKNSAYQPGCREKVFYNENVYRVSGATHQFKEFMQAGLEAIGDIDISDMFEVVYLAAKSLDSISGDYILDISDMGILSAIIQEASDDKSFRKELLKLISEKNKHETALLCDKYSVSRDAKQKILDLIEISGKPKEVLKKIKEYCTSGAIKEYYLKFDKVCQLLLASDVSEHIRIDFSVVNDMKYYNGIVFKGFLKGISEGVLSGGEYGALARRMGKGCDAIGFAIYLDLLEEIEQNSNEFDVDVLLIYSTKTSAETIIATKNKFINEGLSVVSQMKIPLGLRYKTLVDLDKELKQC